MNHNATNIVPKNLFDFKRKLYTKEVYRWALLEVCWFNRLPRRSVHYECLILPGCCNIIILGHKIYVGKLYNSFRKCSSASKRSLH